MRMIRYGGGRGGWGSLDAGAMSAHILSRADSGSTALTPFLPRRLFHLWFLLWRGDGRWHGCIVRPMCVFFGFGAGPGHGLGSSKVGRLPDRAALHC